MNLSAANQAQPVCDVIIPAYNAEAYIGSTVESALRQTAPVCVTVVDDGSADRTVRMCERFGDAIRLIQQSNSGVSKARNNGAANTTAPWLLFLDSDDRLLPHAVEALVETAATNKAGLAYGRTLMRGRREEETRLHGGLSAAGDPPAPALANFRRSVISTPGAAVVSRELHERIGGFAPGFEPMEDRDYWIKCGLVCRFAFCDTVVLDKTFREGSAGSNAEKRIRSTLRSRLEMPAWSRQYLIDISVLELDNRTCIDLALKEAIWHGLWNLSAEVLVKARQLSVRTFWTRRAAVQLWMMGILRPGLAAKHS